MASLIAEAVAGAVSNLFSYNRENYKYDRHLRQKMEYKQVDMRLQQAELWRKDVRMIVELTLTKMEAYLLVIAIELGCCVSALCMGRVPPGAPAWLAECHTLSLVSALTYLFMAMWLGLHAFVAAQASKVKILTHWARLPIPTWETVEMGRTYESSFEKMTQSQMCRVPFAMGKQEEMSCLPLSQLRAAFSSDSAQGPAAGPSADPWGLERRVGPEDIPELAPDVNEKTEKQRIVQYVRENSESYQTYDAFCRIAMSTGTCSLAQFLCYFCLTYVLTEDASPAPAWTGMLAYSAIALVLLRLDMKLKGHEYLILSFLMIVPPMICGFVTFVNSKGKGAVGMIEYIMPLVPLLHAFWYIYYLWVFQVIELEDGALLPATFGSVLYLDAFGWAPKPPQSRSATPSSSGSGGDGASRTYLQRARDWLYGNQPELPSMRVLDPRLPSRPADSERFASKGRKFLISASCSPAPSAGSEDTASTETEDYHFSDKHHANVPWNTYRWSTILLASLWTFASLANSYHLARGDRDYMWNNRFTDLKRGYVHHGEVRVLQQSVAVVHVLQQPAKLQTKYVSPLTYPRGLSCDPLGKVFVTSGLDSNGQKSLLHARLSDSGMNFQSLSHCLHTEDMIEDVTLHHCGQQGEDCAALLLPREGERLIQCSISRDNRGGNESVTRESHGVFSQMSSASSMPLLLGRAWLDDRGASALEGSPFEDSKLEVDDHPEEISAVATIPCSDDMTNQCLVVGTTARRVVLLAAKQLGASATGPVWVPQRILINDVGEVPGPGAFALLGDRHLGILLRGRGHLRVLDLHDGGNHAADIQLPREQRWNSVCAGGGSIFALEHGDDPSLWQFAAPKDLVSHSGHTAAVFAERAQDKQSILHVKATSHTDAIDDSSSFMSAAVSVVGAHRLES